MNRKTALITGASRGIGRATAFRFAEAGYDLVLGCRERMDCLRQVQSQVEEKGARCELFCGDLSQPETIERLGSFLEEQRLGIDVLVSNAGTSYSGVVQDLPLSEWHRVMDTNVTALFLLSRLVIPQMLQRGAGKIVCTSSVYGTAGASCEAVYSASKGAINAFVKSLARELAPSHIQVNAVAPGATDTEMIAFIGEEGYQRLREEIPMGRIARPEEIAEVIFSLATAPDYMSGQIVAVDGCWF